MERAHYFKVEWHVYIPDWCPPFPHLTSQKKNFSIWQVKDEIGVISWLNTCSVDGQTPWYPRVWFTRGKLCFLLLRQQIYTGLTIIRFRKSLVYFNCVQLFFYFFLQFEGIERLGWKRNSGFIHHRFEIFWFLVVRGKFIKADLFQNSSPKK